LRQELESPCRDTAAARLRRNHVPELELPSFPVDPEGKAESEERPISSVDNGECLSRALSTALFVELEPLPPPPRRHRVGVPRIAEHVLVVEHPRDAGQVTLAKQLESAVGH